MACGECVEVVPSQRAFRGSRGGGGVGGKRRYLPAPACGQDGLAPEIAIGWHHVSFSGPYWPSPTWNCGHRLRRFLAAGRGILTFSFFLAHGPSESALAVFYAVEGRE